MVTLASPTFLLFYATWLKGTQGYPGSRVNLARGYPACLVNALLGITGSPTGSPAYPQVVQARKMSIGIVA